jgi:hypothetical protein
MPIARTLTALEPDKGWTDAENALLFYYLHTDRLNMKALRLNYENIAKELQKETAYIAKWYPTIGLSNSPRAHTAHYVGRKEKRMIEKGKQWDKLAPRNPKRAGKEGYDVDEVWYSKGTPVKKVKGRRVLVEEQQQLPQNQPEGRAERESPEDSQVGSEGESVLSSLSSLSVANRSRKSQRESTFTS